MESAETKVHCCHHGYVSVSAGITLGQRRDVWPTFLMLLSISQVNDTLYEWSNTGACIDVFAPGVQIYSACGAAGEVVSEQGH